MNNWLTDCVCVGIETLRLFRTACLAIAASQIRTEDNIHLDVEKLFAEVKIKAIPVERWNGFIAETIKELKVKRKEAKDKELRTIQPDLALM